MDATELQLCIVAHLQWKAKLADFIYGVEELNRADVPDHTSCHLGKLIQDNLNEFNIFIEFPSLKSLHEEIHENINTLINMPYKDRKSSMGKQALENFKKKSDRLIEMIERLETQVRPQ